MNVLEMAALGLVGILPHTMVLAALLFILRLVLDRVTPFDDAQEMRMGNVAASINRAGAYLALGVAVAGSLIRSEKNYWYDLRMFVLDGILALIVFVIAHFVFDWVILRGVNNALQIQLGNVATGIVEACAYLQIGLIISASFSGGGQTFWPGMLSAVVFSFVALATSMAGYSAYVYAKYKLTGYHIDRAIAAGNKAAAIDVGTLMVAMGLTLWFSISGDFVGWGEDLLSYAVAALSSTIAVLIGRGLASVALAHGLKAKTANIARSLTVGGAGIGFGLLSGLVTFV